MAIKNVAFNIRADGSETVNVQATLIAAVTTAIGDAGTANAAGGSNADVTTELAAVTASLAAVTANQPTGAIVVSYDTSIVTTKNQLRKLLDAAYRHFADAQNVLT